MVSYMILAHTALRSRAANWAVQRLKHIKAAATRNFDPANKIDEGEVYKVHLCISVLLIMLLLF